MSCASRFSTSGSATATSMRDPSRCVGSAPRRRASSSGSSATTSGSISVRLRSTTVRPSCSASTSVSERSPSRSSSTSRFPSRLPDAVCFSSASLQLVLGDETAADEQLTERAAAAPRALARLVVGRRCGRRSRRDRSRRLRAQRARAPGWGLRALWPLRGFLARRSARRRGRLGPAPGRADAGAAFGARRDRELDGRRRGSRVGLVGKDRVALGGGRLVGRGRSSAPGELVLDHLVDRLDLARRGGAGGGLVVVVRFVARPGQAHASPPGCPRPRSHARACARHMPEPFPLGRRHGGHQPMPHQSLRRARGPSR